MQTLKMGTLGTTTYRGSVGKFLSSVNLREPDYKFQKKKRSYLVLKSIIFFSKGDLVDLTNKRLHLQIHLVHHDNGAIINKIPFMKKTRIGLVLGAATLYVKEHNWQHYEVLSGWKETLNFQEEDYVLASGVLSYGNNFKPQATWKDCPLPS